MIPQRFQNLRPYLASWIQPRFTRPPLREMLRWYVQPGKEKRAARFIEEVEVRDGYREVKFKGVDGVFYYPAQADWTGFCQTVDECFNPKHWHHFLSNPTPLDSDDVVIDCGAAEGLFTFIAAHQARKVYAIEPIPIWHEALHKMMDSFNNVELLKVGVGHKQAQMHMSENEVCSRISSAGGLAVQIETLDVLFADQPITYIKADLEGYEFPMLLGAEEVIRRNRPKISVTVYHKTNHFVEIRKYLKNIHEDYTFVTRGIADNGNPTLLQAH